MPGSFMGLCLAREAEADLTKWKSHLFEICTEAVRNLDLIKANGMKCMFCDQARER
jgi:hypothetical protein